MVADCFISLSLSLPLPLPPQEFDGEWDVRPFTREALEELNGELDPKNGKDPQLRPGFSMTL